MMTKCEYESVLDGIRPLEGRDEDKSISWKPFLRQLQISSCVWSMYFQLGLCVGANTVLIPRMREEHGENYVTRDMASWISSAIMYTGLLWSPVIVFMTAAIGRRYTFAFGTVTSLVGFAVLSVSETPLHVLAGMIIQGPIAALAVTITLLVLTEYTSPLYRGVFLTIKSATIYWGVWVANAIGTVTHWHYIAWLGLACVIYNLVNLFAWPESPYWLAGKGRLEQCKEAHWWLKGHGLSSEKELQELIQEHQRDSDEKNELITDKHQKMSTDKWRQIWHEMRSKCFYKPLLYNAALACQFQFMGKAVFSIYAIDIIENITKSTREAYKGMLILDGVTVLGMYVGCVLSKKFTRRRLLVSAGGAGCISLLIMSVYLALVRFQIISENKYITVFLLICYSLFVSCGPVILNSTLAAELLPLRLRGTAALFVAMGNNFLMGTSIKAAPYIFSYFGFDGVFLFYALTSGSFLGILYLYLPETKDKTLKEIQDLIIGVTVGVKPELKEIKEMSNVESKDV